MSRSAPPISVRTSRRIGAYASLEPGPTVLATAAVHGNEYAGVLALEELFRRLEEHRPPTFRGRLIGLVGNLGALNEGERYRVADLNRLASPANAAFVRRAPFAALRDEMRELKDLLAEIEAEVERAAGPIYHLDLHTVSSTSPPFTGVPDSGRSRELAARLPIPVILGIDRHLSGLLVDLTARRYQATSFVVEGGQHDDPKSVARHEAALRIVLGATGVLKPGVLPWDHDAVEVLSAAAGARIYRTFEIVHREAIGADDFRMRDGVEPFTPIVRGETALADANGHALHAARSGLLFMPNRQKSPRKGDDAYFVVREVERIRRGH